MAIKKAGPNGPALSVAFDKQPVWTPESYFDYSKTKILVKCHPANKCHPDPASAGEGSRPNSTGFFVPPERDSE